MAEIKIAAASGGGSISIKGPSSSGSDTDLLDTSGNVHITGNLGVGTSPSHLVHIEKDTGSGAAGTKVVIENPNTNSVNNNVELYLKTARGDFGFKHYNATESYIQVPDQLIINTNNATSATQALHIDTSQNVKVSNGNLVIGTSGKGIDFSATAGPTNGTGSSELLDDYEEGTWTPSYNNDGDWVHGAITVHRYIKVGNQVTVSGNIRSNENTAGNNAFYITSLPFTSADISNMKWVGSMGGDNGWNNTNTSLIALISHNSQHLRLHKNNTGVGMGDISFGGDVGPDANIYYTITYQAA